jgi:hypothetical protein
MIKGAGGEIRFSVQEPTDLAPLRPVAPPARDTGENPLHWFYDRRQDYAEVNPQLVVRLAQYATGTELNDRDLGNLYGWVQEEAARYQAMVTGSTGEQ